MKKTAIIDASAYADTKEILNNYGFNVVETLKIPQINDSTATHPDMQFLYFGSNFALTVDQCYDYYKNSFPDLNFKSIGSVYSPYPYDSLLNVTIVGDYCFATKKQWETINRFIDLKPIIIKQGYSKCNICILNNKAIITSDKGIASEAPKNHLKAYFLPSDEIALSGYKNGFWGGCCGLIDNNKLLFNGDITALNCYNDLIDILEKEKIEPIYHRAGELRDIGSILTVI